MEASSKAAINLFALIWGYSFLCIYKTTKHPQNSRDIVNSQAFQVVCRKFVLLFKKTPFFEKKGVFIF